MDLDFGRGRERGYKRDTITTPPPPAEERAMITNNGGADSIMLRALLPARDLLYNDSGENTDCDKRRHCSALMHGG